MKYEFIERDNHDCVIYSHVVTDDVDRWMSEVYRLSMWPAGYSLTIKVLPS